MSTRIFNRLMRGAIIFQRVTICAFASFVWLSRQMLACLYSLPSNAGRLASIDSRSSAYGRQLTCRCETCGPVTGWMHALIAKNVYVHDLCLAKLLNCNNREVNNHCQRPYRKMELMFKRLSAKSCETYAFIVVVYRMSGKTLNFLSRLLQNWAHSDQL